MDVDVRRGGDKVVVSLTTLKDIAWCGRTKPRVDSDACEFTEEEGSGSPERAEVGTPEGVITPRPNTLHADANDPIDRWE